MPRVTRAQLIRLQKKLGTDEAIGRKFRITRQAVHQLRTRLGVVSLRVKNTERNARIVAMYEAGVPARELAERFGLSISQTFRVANANRKRRRRKK